eukprot:356444_1
MSSEEIQVEGKPNDGFRTQLYTDTLNRWFSHPRKATYSWCFFSGTYWTLLVLIPGLIRHELNTYQYYLWFVGQIGVCSVYYCTRADYPADSSSGKPVMAMTCLLMSVDWISHALAALQLNMVNVSEGLIMLGHSISILWASLFFYNRAIQNGRIIAWLSLLLQWIDIVFCCISVLVLHSTEGECWNTNLCIGYFVILVLNLFFWFFPIMFGLSNTEKYIHMHMVILDMCTDLPLVAILILSEAYRIHWWIFIDVAFKMIMLCRSVLYHLCFNLVCKRKELAQLQRQQTQQLELQDALWKQGATKQEIATQRMELMKRQSRGIGDKIQYV